MPFSGNLTLHKNSFEFEVFKLLPQAGSFEHRVWVVQSKKHTHEISGVFEISYYNSPLSNKWTLVMKIVQAHDCGMSCFFAEILEGIYREFFHFFHSRKSLIPHQM